MRELEFRAWDKTTKRYWNVGGLSFEKGRLVEVYLENYPTSFEGNEDCKKPDEVILEQCTGLKDKNGKEIYDGDIIVDFDEFISVVDGSCAVISEKTCREKHFDEYDCLLERRTRPLIQVVNDYGYYPEKEETQVEVIGNIHENKELLEE